MSDEPKVSVVMPVYNTAPYLRQCLDSVVNQTLQDIEIICVDDGSTDGSLDILEEYAAADSRMRILRQQNQYAGVARNNGMAVAAGKYLMFWDSDDYFDLTALEKMYDQCEADQADICVCGVRRYYEDIGEAVADPVYIRKAMLPDAVPFNRDTNLPYILNFATPAVWNKMFRRAFVEQEKLAFSATKSANDVLFVEVALCCARAITLVQEPLVNYRRDRVGSLTNTLSVTSLVPIQMWVETACELRRRGIMPIDSFANRAFGNLLYILRNQRDAVVFAELISFLDSDVLRSLCLDDPMRIRDEWQRSCLESITKGDVVEVLLCLMSRSYFAHVKTVAEKRLLKTRVKQLKRELAESRSKASEKSREIVALRASTSFRLGHALTAPARLFRRKKS